MDLPSCLGVQSTNQLTNDIDRQAKKFIGYIDESNRLSYIYQNQRPKVLCKRRTIQKNNELKKEPTKKQVIYYG